MSSPGAIAFQFGPLVIRWYGILMATSIIVALWLAHRQAKREGLPADDIISVGQWAILAGLLGEHPRHNISRGLNLLVVSAVMFLIFGALFGGLGILGPNGPAILLIALGVYMLLRGFLRNTYRGPNETR